VKQKKKRGGNQGRPHGTQTDIPDGYWITGGSTMVKYESERETTRTGHGRKLLGWHGGEKPDELNREGK